MSIKEHPPHHVPVLLDAVIQELSPQRGEHYLDLTAGYGGHARAIIDTTHAPKSACLVDRDAFAIAHLDELASQGARILHSDFVTASHQLIAEQQQFDIVLADLGVSSPQLDRSERGFSFRQSGPLDMRMDQSQTRTAAEYLLQTSENELARVIADYGEEPRSIARRYAKAIKQSPVRLETTDQLAELIERHHVGGWQRIHPATRTFQAIRIAINSELEQVETLLPLLPQLLNPGGRVGIISFHSLEDRLVKRYFADQAASGYEAELTVLTKKPILGTDDVHNPRARSAKLRVAVKK